MEPIRRNFDSLSGASLNLSCEVSRACTHKLRLFGNRWLMSALPPIADIGRRARDVRFVPIADIEGASFDHVVGEREKRWRTFLPPIPHGAGARVGLGAVGELAVKARAERDVVDQA